MQSRDSIGSPVRRPWRGWVVVAFAGALPACSTAPGADELDADALSVLVAEEEHRIGSMDDPAAGFSRIGAVDVDRVGLVYVFEMQDLHIRVYEPDGRLVRTIGRRGEGPGEFQGAAGFGVVGDTIWAIESFGRGRRLTLFTRDGDVLSTARVEGVSVALQNPEQTALVMPVSMRADGLFTSDLTTWVARRETTPTGVAPTDTVAVPRVLFHALGAVVDTIGWSPYPPPETSPLERVEIGGTPYNVPRPPASRPLLRNLEDGRVVVERRLAATADQSIFRVIRLSLADDTIYDRRFAYTPRGYSAAALDTFAARSARIPGGAYRIVGGTPVMMPTDNDPVAVQADIRSAMSFPAFQPPIQQDHMGEDGGLWLRREDRGDATFEWVLLDPDGQPRGRLVLPRGTRVAWSAGPAFWAVELDAFEVPWLIGYRISEVVQ